MVKSLEFAIAEGVEVKVNGNEVAMKGKAGEVKRVFSYPLVSIESKEGKIILSTKKENKTVAKMMFTYRAHLKNMQRGCQEGHEYLLKVCSSHFPMNVAVNKNQLVVKNFLGEKFPRTLNLKEGVEVKVDGDKIQVKSTSIEIAGSTASAIEELMKRPGFDNRIFQDGIYITSKDGKEIK